MSRLVLAFVLPLLLVPLTCASAATIHVPADQPTIQAGIDAASYGDTVLVACGTYYEHDIRISADTCVRLVSETGEAGCVIIDAQQEGFVLFAGPDTDVHIVGITLMGGWRGAYSGGGVMLHSGEYSLTNCAFIGNAARDGGGGLYCQSATELTLTNCTFLGNVCSPVGMEDWGGGGGLYCLEATEVSLTDCTFSGNDSGNQPGGGASLGLGTDGTALLTDCTFSGNISGRRGGGGVFLELGLDDTALLTDCTFSGNIANGEYAGGGGLRCWGFGWHPETALVGCTFSGNTAERGGGGMMSSTAATLTNCAFEGNSAIGSADPYDNVGGGVSLVGGPISLAGCSFDQNSASFAGGAYIATLDIGNPAVLTDCSFTDNATGDAGGGVFLNDGGSATLSVCTFSGNTSSDDYGYGGGGVLSWSVSPTFVDCTFSNNSSSLGGGLATSLGCSATLMGCTIADNTSGVRVAHEQGYGPSAVTLTNSIIASSTDGAAVFCEGESSASLTCCDVYGNTGGDWVGCIADQYGVAGNFSEDPLLCLEDDPSEPYSLHEGSPCLPENSPCGELVGAFGQGCGAVSAIEAVSWSAIKAMFR